MRGEGIALVIGIMCAMLAIIGMAFLITHIEEDKRNGCTEIKKVCQLSYEYTGWNGLHPVSMIGHKDTDCSLTHDRVIERCVKPYVYDFKAQGYK